METRVALPLLVLLVILVGLTLWRVDGLVRSFPSDAVQVEFPDMQTMTTEWISGGQKQKLTTHRNPGEDEGVFIDRHLAVVRAAQKPERLPPDE